jgi:hypothetical protein
MSTPQRYIFNNSFPDHYKSSISEDDKNDFSDYTFSFSTPNNQSSTSQTLDLPDSENEIQRWTELETKTLLSYLSENFDLYRKRKNKFCAKAALKIGNKRTTSQVNLKIQSLITKFEEENREETGKGRSCWEYFDEMNEIFGNRENVQPDYLLSSINVDKV